VLASACNHGQTCRGVFQPLGHACRLHGMLHVMTTSQVNNAGAALIQACGKAPSLRIALSSCPQARVRAKQLQQLIYSIRWRAAPEQRLKLARSLLKLQVLRGVSMPNCDQTRRSATLRTANNPEACAHAAKGEREKRALPTVQKPPQWAGTSGLPLPEGSLGPKLLVLETWWDVDSVQLVHRLKTAAAQHIH
jgi:hypothetical protein